MPETNQKILTGKKLPPKPAIDTGSEAEIGTDNLDWWETSPLNKVEYAND